jgi:hypothetical protein
LDQELREALCKKLCEAQDITAAMVLIPTVKWAQRKALIYITLDVQDVSGNSSNQCESRGWMTLIALLSGMSRAVTSL